MTRKVQSRKFRISKDVEITESIIIKLIEKHKNEKSRCEKMLDYYDGRNDILDKVYKKLNRPANKVPHPIASYLCNMLVGYTLGNSITYKSENEELLEALNEILAYNDIADLDQALADLASAVGYGYEIQYIDEEANPRMACVSSEEMMVLFDNTLEENMLYALRYWEEEDLLNDGGEKRLYVELYDKESIRYYEGDTSTVKLVDQIEHQYGDVPVTVFPLNRNWFGAFEKVIHLIDKYDQAQSDTANVMESNASKAILVISGMVLDDDEGESSLEADVINFTDPSSTASFLTKNIDTTAIEAYLDRLMNDIHTLSQIPPLDQEGFVASASGESLKWKCLGLEILASTFESRFRKAIKRRLELLCRILSIKHNKEYDFNEIEVVFTRNTPANTTELANIVKSLYGIVSEETLLSLLPFISDVQAEKDRLASEAEEDSLEVDYSDFSSNINNDVETDGDIDDEEI